MPELPEVQTIATDLEKVLPGLKILDIWTDYKKAIKHPDNFEKFKKEIAGKKILKVERLGKNILINLSQDKTLLVHQKMTGHLLYGKWELDNKSKKWKSKISGPLQNDPENRFIHFVWFLSNKYQLALCDMRKFAKVLIWPTSQLKNLTDIKNIGPDPMSKNFNFKKFKEIIQNKTSKKKEMVKNFLMDQTAISGIGNIYSDEILWQAGVHPLKLISELSEKELRQIYNSIRPVLKKAIKARGSSYIDYRDAFGEKGKYQHIRYAYQRTGEPCKKKDSGIIEKIKIKGRAGHFCPIHQKI